MDGGRRRTALGLEQLSLAPNDTISCTRTNVVAHIRSTQSSNPRPAFELSCSNGDFEGFANGFLWSAWLRCWFHVRLSSDHPLIEKAITLHERVPSVDATLSRVTSECKHLLTFEAAWMAEQR